MLLGGFPLPLRKQIGFIPGGQHSPFADHALAQQRRLFNIVGRSVGNLLIAAQVQGFGLPARQRYRHVVQQLLSAMKELFRRNGHAVARRALAGGDDGDPADLAFRQKQGRQQGVTRFVGGGQFPFGLLFPVVRALHAEEHSVQRFVHILPGDFLRVPLGSADGGLVQQALQLRPGEKSGLRRQRSQRNLRGQRLFPGVNFQNFLPFPQGRQRHLDLPVEAACPQQGFIQRIGPVGGRQHHNAVAFPEAAHFRQKGVEGLFPLVAAVVPLFAHRVDLIKEDHRFPGLAGLLKQRTHPAGAHAHVHFHKIRAVDREERNARFTGQRPSQQRLARARRAIKQHAPRNPCPETAVLLRRLNEADQIAQTFQRFFVGGHIGKAHIGY